MSDPRSSPPPPPPSPKLETETQRAVRVAEEARARSKRAELRSSDAVELAGASAGKVAELGRVVGEPPNALTGHEGTGLHLVLHRMAGKLDDVLEVVEEIRATRASRQDWQTWALRLVVGALLLAVVGSAVTLAARVRLEPAPAAAPAARP